MNLTQKAHNRYKLLEISPWMVPPWSLRSTSTHWINARNEMEPSTVPPWKKMAETEQGTNRLREMAPWMVPLWEPTRRGYIEIEEETWAMTNGLQETQ